MSGVSRCDRAALAWRESAAADSGSTRPATDAVVAGAARGRGLTLGQRARYALAAAWRALLPALYEQRALLGIIAIYVLAGYAVQFLWPVPGMMHMQLYSEVLFIVAAIWSLFALVGRAAWVMFTYRGSRSLYYATWSDLRQHYLSGPRLAGFALVMLTFPFFLSAFGSFKNVLPVLHPFTWDARFMAWDRILHGGRHPWQWLQPILGYPWVTTIVNAGYHLWFFLMFGIMYWQMWSNRRELRMRFLISFLLVWIVIGTVAAIGLSSAGPCYYGRVAPGPDPYADLMQYLRQANTLHPVWALSVQETLWKIYCSGRIDAIGGITAMPSMHLAVAWLFALLGWQYGRWAGSLLTAFAVLTLVGSVHLGWHYALDGYVAGLLTVVIWWAVGRWTKAQAWGLQSPGHSRAGHPGAGYPGAGSLGRDSLAADAASGTGVTATHRLQEDHS